MQRRAAAVVLRIHEQLERLDAAAVRRLECAERIEQRFKLLAARRAARVKETKKKIIKMKKNKNVSNFFSFQVSFFFFSCSD